MKKSKQPPFHVILMTYVACLSVAFFGPYLAVSNAMLGNYAYASVSLLCTIVMFINCYLWAPPPKPKRKA